MSKEAKLRSLQVLAIDLAIDFVLLENESIPLTTESVPLAI